MTFFYFIFFGNLLHLLFLLHYYCIVMYIICIMCLHVLPPSPYYQLPILFFFAIYSNLRDRSVDFVRVVIVTPRDHQLIIRVRTSSLGYMMFEVEGTTFPNGCPLFRILTYVVTFYIVTFSPYRNCNLSSAYSHLIMRPRIVV